MIDYTRNEIHDEDGEARGYLHLHYTYRVYGEPGKNDEYIKITIPAGEDPQKFTELFLQNYYRTHVSVYGFKKEKEEYYW